MSKLNKCGGTSWPIIKVWLCNYVAGRAEAGTPVTSILDLGLGRGDSGYKLRASGWTGVLDGVETFPEGISAYARTLYDSVVVGRIEDEIGIERGVYDLVLLLDVIEHYESEAAVELLKKMFELHRRGAYGAVAISTPRYKYRQGVCGGNVWEIHKSWWAEESWTRLKPDWAMTDSCGAGMWIWDETKVDVTEVKYIETNLRKRDMR